MRQPGSPHHIPDGVDMRHRGLHELVDLHISLIEPDTQLREAQILGDRCTADCHQQHLGSDALLSSSFVHQHHLQPVVRHLGRVQLGAGKSTDLPLAERALKLLGDLLVLEGQEAR